MTATARWCAGATVLVVAGALLGACAPTPLPEPVQTPSRPGVYAAGEEVAVTGDLVAVDMPGGPTVVLDAEADPYTQRSILGDLLNRAWVQALTAGPDEPEAAMQRVALAVIDEVGVELGRDLVLVYQDPITVVADTYWVSYPDDGGIQNVSDLSADDAAAVANSRNPDGDPDGAWIMTFAGVPEAELEPIRID